MRWKGQVMPFCPKCRYEYREGIVVCPDCDEKLVASLPEEFERDSLQEDETHKDWVQLARLNSYEYAQMVYEALRKKHIPAVILSGAGHFGQLGQLGPSSFRPVGGGYSLFVPNAFISEADREGEIILGDGWKKARLVNFGR
jgi:hypothetical protein